MDTPQQARPTGEERARARPWALVPIAAAAVLALIVRVTGLDLPILYLFNDTLRVGPDGLWSHLTVLGDATIAVAAMAFIIRRMPQVLWAMVIAALITSTFVQVIKPTANLKRPPYYLEQDDRFHLIGPDHFSRSFPSGHSATAFTVAGVFVLAFLRSRAARLAALAAAVLISLSRMSVGIHWAFDIAGGAFFAWTGAAVGTYVADRYPVRSGSAAHLASATIVILGCIWLVTLHDIEYAEATVLQYVLGSACLLTALVETTRVIAERARAAPEDVHPGTRNH